MLTCIEDVLDADALAAIRAGIDTREFVDGVTTAGFRARRVKHNQQMRSDRDSRKTVSAELTASVERCQTFRRSALPKRIRPWIISR